MCAVPEWVHSTPCGVGGTCRESHRGRWYFSFCECYPGFAGWNCSRTSDPASGAVDGGVNGGGWLSPAWAVALLTVSNAAFVPAVVVAARRRLWSAAAVYGLMTGFSTVYHACDAEQKNTDMMDRTHLCFVYFEVRKNWTNAVVW
jgi:hypothetical protein